jgi:uncharacterized protein (TIGR02271 family)
MTRDLGRGSVVAIFENPSDAENAVRELREDGFSAHRLGCATGRRSNQEDHRSFWQKIEGFFSGEEGYEDRNTGSGDGVRETGPVVDRTLTVPDQYNERLDAGCTMVAVYGSDRLDRAEQILLANDGEIQRNFDEHQREFATGSHQGAERKVTESEDGRIQLLSERLLVNKQRVNTGEVRVRKEVRTEQQNIQVPVTREELVIERAPVSESQAINREIGAGDEIRVPLSEERVEVEKRPVVREEVRVGKRAIEETRNVSDQTRHEELKVDRSGNAPEIDEDDIDRKRTA